MDEFTVGLALALGATTCLGYGFFLGYWAGTRQAKAERYRAAIVRRGSKAKAKRPPVKPKPTVTTSAPEGDRQTASTRPSALQVAKEICHQSEWAISHLRLQKTLFIAQCVYLAEFGEPLFAGEFQARNMGPIEPTVAKRCEMFGSGPVKNIFHDVSDIPDPDALDFLDDLVPRVSAVSSPGLISFSEPKVGAWATFYSPGSRCRISIAAMIEDGERHAERLGIGLSPGHPGYTDDRAVDRFAGRMRDKLAKARAKGRGGWDNPDQCSGEDLARMLVGHLDKANPGNYVDVANFCMMLDERGEPEATLAKAFWREVHSIENSTGCETVEVCLGCGRPVSDDCGCPAGTTRRRSNTLTPSTLESEGDRS